MSSIVAGVDSGGSRTRLMLAEAEGAAIATVEGPGSGVRPGASERSADVIAALLRDALAAANLSHVTPQALCVGAAGVGREDERQALTRALLSREVAEVVLVHPDATIALEDAFGEGSGVLVIAGTGSVAFGRGPAGIVDRCGGWGSVCGDEGSGAWIGRRALSVVTAAADGREADTALSGAILTATESRDATDLIPWAAAASPAELAALAPVVMATADAGDPRAAALVSFAAEELVVHVRTLARRLFADERAAMSLALAGGLMRPRSPLRVRLEHRLRSAVPGGHVKPHEVVPVRGAVTAARRLLLPTRT
ncbi:MAG: BadF/BadG/BcrA/BcrD ATPase family protein [Gemmatimonadaceae bacterium]